MMPLHCPSCGASYISQEPTCARCGAPRPMPRTSVQVQITITSQEQPSPRRASGLSLTRTTIALLVIGGIVVALLAGFGVFKLSTDIAPPNTTGPGWWKATAPGLGTFQFKVTDDQSAITEFVFQIPQITCPDISYSVTFVDVQSSPPWQVENGQFSADVQLRHSPSVDVAVSGTIASANQQASGTWDFDGEDGPCQGSWTGVPSQ